MSLLREAEKCLANQKTYASLNAFITPLQRAGPWRDRVRDSDTRRERGVTKSPLDGKLVAIKDNICTRDMPTTCASRILDTYTSPFNATVVESLEKSGAIIAGKTNLDEFGMGSHSMHSHFGPVKNVTESRREPISPGGSSGGSAVAVATGQCYAALGTDTGGSVRLPAAYTGTVGFKPSYGHVSRWGVVAYANSLDTVGVLGSSISTIREVYKTINHPDLHDPTNLPPATRTRLTAAVHNSSTTRSSPSPYLRIGIPTEYNIHELSPTVRTAWQRSIVHLQRMGHTILPVSLPATKHALAAYYVLAPAEASSNLARYDGVRYGTRDTDAPDDAEPGGYLYASSRGKGLGSEVKRRILLGAFSLSADAIDNYFLQAQRVRRLVQADFERVFRVKNPLLPAVDVDADVDGRDKKQIAGDNAGVDVLVVPTAPTLPPTVESLKRASTVETYMNDIFTVPASLAGLPALSVPVQMRGLSTVGDGDESKGDGADAAFGSVGIQAIGQFGDDEMVLHVGEMLEGMHG
ncbi:glutamyl-tRNA amidotransferase subunit A [Histoplasma capsulatum G186AR]|uniref:Glutamyl-tRNA(Gln) amidotransferase subunit A, mitochondrial n=2 Tax=Ajellomyces capsulatus TaxID=5037 RepID=GATA_AJECG|nr:glutamyl-tRNA amidotransferase subunit A [Histoplasma capsulatum G186AR]C0NYZ7.1 RecName: Full=Glutamyl-tRNA(Gln) amidotransferase subunit A, mitochondrial; Short=Glu-AdT subunit A [Histoplasma capsulatum G186AR]EEH03437.1 glutamyl-tRNA amidotransferase subunit A [Histoplasma capsulatum G186AR]KAG5295849.1 glutamyl-tRNA amidotransferase subunit A [Histoplasma capsulatum]QSS73832.1 glutamyl-tRNA amidotransferase subunit A [Histoplasma capsulatum G186AR]